MGLQKKMIPIGIEDFKKLRKNDHYYVDKNGLIRELLANRAEVILFAPAPVRKVHEHAGTLLLAE